MQRVIVDPLTGMPSIQELPEPRGRGGGSASGVRSVVAGTNILVDNSDPRNPIINATSAEYNVKDYGATGDGSTNDTVTIQAALDACTTAGGGTVYFPAGTYMVDADPDVGSYTTVRGDGFMSCVKRMAGPNYANNFRVQSKTKVRFTNLRIDGSKQDIIDNYSATALDSSHIYTTCNTIYITGGNDRDNPSTDVTIDNCWIHDSYFGAVQTDDVDGLIVTNCYLYHNRDNQINARVNGWGGYTRNAVISNNMVYGVGPISDPNQYSGIQFLRGQYLTITNNLVYGFGNTTTWEGNGIGMEGCRHVTISGNTVHSNLTQGIKVDRTVEGEPTYWYDYETYLEDEYVIHNGNKFYALQDSVDQAPPSTATSNAYWQYTTAAGGDQWSIDVVISNNIIANNNFYGEYGSTTDGFYYQYSKQITFTGNTLYGNYHGIKNGPHVGPISFINNVIENSQHLGVMLYETNDQQAAPIFKGNTIRKNGSKGIDSVIPVIIESNYIAENNGAGVAVGMGGTPTLALPFIKVSHNTFVDNADSGIVVNGGIADTVNIDVEFNFAPPSSVQPRGLGENGSKITARFNRFVGQTSSPYYLSDPDSVWIDETTVDDLSVHLAGDETITGVKIFNADSYNGSVITNDITIRPNAGRSTSASMFLDNTLGNIWEFFSSATGAFGVFNASAGNQPFSIAADAAGGSFEIDQYGPVIGGRLYMNNKDINAVGDVRFNDTSRGPVIKSPDGAEWRIKVDNSGNITAVAA